MLSLKQIAILLLVVIATLVLVKTDLLTKARIKATTLYYGAGIREVGGLRLIVESISPELQNEGITPALVRDILTPKLQSGGMKIVSEDEAQKQDAATNLNVSVTGSRLEGKTYQYMVIMEIQRKKSHTTGFFQSNEVIWSSSRTGAGSLGQIKEGLLKEADTLINATSGKV